MTFLWSATCCIILPNSPNNYDILGKIISIKITFPNWSNGRKTEHYGTNRQNLNNLYIYFVIYTNKFGIKEKSTQLWGMVCPHSLGNVLSKGPLACLYSTFNVAFALGLGACWYYSRNLDIPPFLWSASVFKCRLCSARPTLYNNLNVYIHVIRSFVALVYNFLGKLNYFVIKVSAT